MKEQYIQKLTLIIQEQVQMFLLDAGEFYPFGTCIDKNENVKPVGVYLDNDNPTSLEVISLLEENMKRGVENGQYKIGAVVIDVTIKEGEVNFDAIEIRFFEPDNQEYKRRIKYKTYGSHIEFM
ncbi:hypothetical protein TH53_19240 [Pedobacter lusitanus]|uniref:Uncharacterized protein n=1 Tax=Pedobacter lusitanus TaxID=1503925 RepID=A0A0D0GHT2_9SPHI|nr:hypothetical protein [Pedobacter lusitanus]KIO75690.1 hypothetical protein TH53_19240 [Pedobacter lusitanus]